MCEVACFGEFGKSKMKETFAKGIKRMWMDSAIYFDSRRIGTFGLLIGFRLISLRQRK